MKKEIKIRTFEKKDQAEAFEIWRDGMIEVAEGFFLYLKFDN